MSRLDALGRTLADSADRASWLDLHDRVIGASTAATFARPGSVETYVRSILKPRSFGGNATTESGNRWEPLLLSWAGAEQNTLFIHQPDNERFAATPDGSYVRNRALFLTEIKAKHNKVVTGPTPREVRQVAWQLLCIPEADGCEFIWGELVQKDGEWDLRRKPQSQMFFRDHPSILAAQELIVPIAHKVIAALDAAQAVKAPF